MSEYYITVKTLSPEGKPCKAEISCGGRDRGSTDERTGMLSFPVGSKDIYDIYAKRYGKQVSGKVRGGEEILMRLKE